MRRPAALCAFTLALSVTTPVLAAHALSVPAPSAVTTRLTNSVVPNLAAAKLVGHLPSTQQLQVTVALDHPSTAGEIALQRALYDPKSPSFHKFLSPAQYAARFGASSADLARVTSWLTRAGMGVAYSSPSRTQVVVKGTVAQAEKTFDTTLNSYSVNGVTFRANPTQALVPAGVSAVQGLQTASSYVLPKRSTGNDLCFFECVGGYEPSELWKVYDLPSASTGHGVRAAVIGEGDTAHTIAGLRAFEAHNGLPQVPTRSVFVANDKTSVDGDGEWQIDSQALTGMAPDLEELSFYFSQDLPSVANAISAWVNDPAGPSIANMSIGGCEVLNLALGTPVVEQPLLRQAAMQGRTLFTSTGDTGGSCLLSPLVNTNGVENTGIPNPQWPSTSDSVVGVGGTVLYTAPNADETRGESRDLEYTWTHGGGGTSSFIPAPAWQKDIALVKAPCTTTYDLKPVVGYTPCRGVPDVSMLSGDILTNGYTVYNQDGGTFPGGGTSLSSPLWAGVWARMQAASAAPLGLATPKLYGAGLDSFYDISVGSNVQWTAQPRTPVNPTGWDFTNGLGVPVGTALLKAVDGVGASDAGVTNASLPLDTATSVAVAGPASAGPCGSSGVYNDPAGDVYPFPNDVDLTGASVRRVGAGLVVTWSVVDVAATPLSKQYDFGFSIGAGNYEVEGVLSAGRVLDTAHFVDADSFTDLGGAPTVSTSGNTVTVELSSAPAGTLSKVYARADMMIGPGGTPADLPEYVDDLDGSSCAAV